MPSIYQPGIEKPDETEKQRLLREMQGGFRQAQPQAGMIAGIAGRNRNTGLESPYAKPLNLDSAGNAAMPVRFAPRGALPPQAMTPQPATGLMQPQADIPQATMPQAAQARMQSGMQQEGGNFRTKMRPYRNYQANYDPSTGMPVGLRIGKEGGDFYGEFEFQPGGQNSARLAEMMKQNGGGLKLDATSRNVMPSNPEPSFYDLYMRDPEYRNMSLDQKLALSRGFDAQYRRPDRINSGQASYNDFLDIISGGRKSLPGNAYNERKALKLLQNQQERNFNQQMGIDNATRQAAGLQIDRDYKQAQIGNDAARMNMEMLQQQAQGGRRRGGKAQGEGDGVKGFNPSQLFFDEGGNPMTPMDMARRYSIAKVSSNPAYAGMSPDSPEFQKAIQTADQEWLDYYKQQRDLASGAGLMQGLQ